MMQCDVNKMSDFIANPLSYISNIIFYSKLSERMS